MTAHMTIALRCARKGLSAAATGTSCTTSHGSSGTFTPMLYTSSGEPASPPRIPNGRLSFCPSCQPGKFWISADRGKRSCSLVPTIWKTWVTPNELSPFAVSIVSPRREETIRDSRSVATGFSERFSTYWGAKMGTTKSRTSPLLVLRTGRMPNLPDSTACRMPCCCSSESAGGVTSVERYVWASALVIRARRNPE